MNELINSFVIVINDIGRGICNFAGIIFIQSTVLILLLLIIDFLIRKRVRATFRYWIWMLVFLKLILPPSLSSPTGIGNWIGQYFSTDSIIAKQPTNPVRYESVSAGATQESTEPVAVPQIQTKLAFPEPVTPVNPPVATSTEAMPNAPALNTLTWQGIVFLLWLVGVLIITVLLIQRIFFVKGLITQSKPAKNRLVEILNNCREQVGVRRIIQLRLSANVTSPAVCGLFRPVILVPGALLEYLSREKLDAVLIHELAHIKRGDLWINCVQTFLQIAYFYNPFVWLVNLIVRRIREQAVDEMVLVALGDQAKSYSNTLIDIAEMAFSRPALSLRLVGVIESKKALSQRIKHILYRPFPKSAKLGILGLIVIIATASILLPMAKSDEINNPLTRRVVFPYSVWMADINNDDIRILDFASGEIIILPDVLNEGDLLKQIESMQKGDVYVSYKNDLKKPMFTFFNGAGLGGESATNEYSIVSPVPVVMPYETIVTTDKGCKYKFVCINADDNECIIEYQPLNRKAKKAMEAGNSASQSSEFKASLSNGVTVELVGVCEHPSGGKQWWKPDGYPKGNAAYEKIEEDPYLKRILTDRDSSGRKREFALRLNGIRENSCDIRWRVRPSQFSGLRDALRNNESVKGMKAIVASIPVENDRVRLEIGVSSGDWKTVAGGAPDRDNSFMTLDGKGSFSNINEQNGKTVLTVSDSFTDFDYNVIAVDNDDGIHMPANMSPVLSSARLTTVTFDNLPLETIKEFQFQIRPYEWVTFNNVSLEQGILTDLQIDTKPSSTSEVTENVEKNQNSNMQIAVDGGGIQAEQENLQAKKIFLPDVDIKALMLDLESGELVDVPKADTPEKIAQALEKLTKGDIVFDTSALILVRGAATKSQTETITGQFKAFKIDQKLPVILSVTTNEGKSYTIKVLAIDNNGCRLEYYPLRADAVPAAMVGTWFFDNPMGDDEQMAIFPDGRVVVLYSNGHKDETRYENGSIELTKYKIRLTLLNNTTLIEYSESEDGGLAKRWIRIDAQPQMSLLRPLTGQNNSQTNTSAEMSSQADEQILKQLNDITQGMIRAFNDKDIDKLLSYFADDAIALPDQHEIAIGKGAIRNMYLENAKDNNKINTVEILDQNLWVCGDFIFGAGKIKISFTTPTIPYQLSEWLNYVTVRTRQADGSLKIILDSSSATPIPEDGNVPEPERPVVINVASGTKPTDDDMEAAYGQIRQFENTFHKAFIDRNVKTATEFYANDAIVMPWRQNALKGKKEITEYISKDMEKSPLVTMTQNALHVEGNNNMLYIVNLFTWTFKDPSSGQDITFTGKGVHVWMRQKDGSWKILLDLNNVDKPINAN